MVRPDAQLQRRSTLFQVTIVILAGALLAVILPTHPSSWHLWLAVAVAASWFLIGVTYRLWVSRTKAGRENMRT